MNSGDNDRYVQRIVLPSGRSIDVVYFQQGSYKPRTISPRTPYDHEVDGESNSSKQDLNVCPKCRSDLVYPTEWEDISETHWEVALRCPECEWEHVGVFEQSLLDRFDEALDGGTADLIHDLRSLMRVNMEEEVERFVRALESDAVWPMDF